jgi:hypothetical protein
MRIRCHDIHVMRICCHIVCIRKSERKLRNKNKNTSCATKRMRAASRPPAPATSVTLAEGFR